MTARDWSNISVSIGEAKNGTPFHIKRIYLEELRGGTDLSRGLDFPVFNQHSIQTSYHTLAPGCDRRFLPFCNRPERALFCSAIGIYGRHS
jgi:hypothetical protein